MPLGCGYVAGATKPRQKSWSSPVYLADLADQMVVEPAAVLAYRARRRDVRRMLEALGLLVERTIKATAIDQARSRVAGNLTPLRSESSGPSATR